MGFLVSAIGGIIGSIGSTLVGKTLLQVGLSFAVSKVASLFRKKPSQSSGTEIEVTYGGNEVRKVLCGYCKVKGHFVYANSYGGSNEFFQRPFVLSDFYTTSLEDVWIEGARVDLGAEDPDKGFVVDSGDYAGLIWVKFYDGRQTVVDPSLNTNANPAGRWSQDAIGVGISYIVVTMRYDREKLGQTVEMDFGVKGAPLYDFRKDPSVGGTGTHDYTDPLTWEYPSVYSPVLLAYNYERGFHINGDLFCGHKLPASAMPLDRWLPAVNLCEENINGHARYECAVIISCDQDHGDNLEDILEACGATPVESVGQLWPLMPVAQPIVATFTDADVDWTQDHEFSFQGASRDRLHRLSGSVLDKDNFFVETPLDVITNETNVSIDTDSQDKNKPFRTVTNSDQGMRLLQIHFGENQYQKSASIALGFRWTVLEVGDWIRWNSDEYGGSFVFQVMSKGDKSLHESRPRSVILKLEERDASVYGDGVQTFVPTIPVPPGTPQQQEELVNFSVSPVQGVGNGSVYPALYCQWVTPVDPTVSKILIEYRPVANPTQIYKRESDLSRNVLYLSEGVVSNTEYEFRTKLVTDPFRETTWATWGNQVVSPDTPNTDVNVTLTNANEDFIGRFQSLQEQLDDASERIIDLSNSVALANLSNFNKSDRVAVGVKDAKAAIATEQKLRVSEQEAVAQEIATLSTSVGDNSSAIQTETTARTEADSALAEQLTIVEAKADDNTIAGGLMRFSASVAQDEASASFTQLLRVTKEGQELESGQINEIYTEGGLLKSRTLFKVEQFGITDGSTSNLPFSFTSDGLTIANLIVDNITFKTMISFNGGMKINGLLGRITVDNLA